ANLDGARLSGATIRKADLTSASMRNAKLEGADLTGTQMKDVDLSGADLSRCDLTGARLDRATVAGAKLDGAVLKGANLISVDLSTLPLGNADVSESVRVDDSPEAWNKLQDMIAKHARWVETGGASGARAEFVREDLSGLDLSGSRSSARCSARPSCAAPS